MITRGKSIDKSTDIQLKIDKNIKKLCLLLEYDVVSMIYFDKDYKLATSKEMLLRKGDHYIIAKDRWWKVINNTENNLLSFLTQKQQILFYEKDIDNNESYLPLIENIKREVYIPIFQSMGTNKSYGKDLIACIYLSTFDLDKNISMKELVQGEIYNTIYDLHELCILNDLNYQKNKSVFNLISVISEITLQIDPLTIRHPYKVAQFAVQMARVLNLDKSIEEKIYLAGLLHDIGKIYIDTNILTKEEALTDEEYALLKNHSMYSANMIKSLTELDDISLFVKYHHERYDGGGYPEGLRGESIPLESRIICIADAVDAMLSQRVYKSSMCKAFVVQELLENKGKQFDAHLVDIAIGILSNTSAERVELPANSITWSLLTLMTTKEIYTIEGSLVSYEFGHFFKSDKFDFIAEIGQDEIERAALSIHTNDGNIFDYQVQLDYCEVNQVYISHIDSPAIR